MSQPEFSGFVLAGGHSGRMGRDKATLQYRGIPLVAHALNALRPLTPHLFIAGNRPDLAVYAPVLYDHGTHGPLGAIANALTASPTQYAFILAVDMPLVSTSWLARLAALASESNASAIFSSVNSRLQPLCAIYSRTLLPALNSSLAGGELRATQGMLNAAGASLVCVEATPAEAHELGNFNTPEEFSALP